MQDVIQYAEIVQQFEVLENKTDLRYAEVTSAGVGEFVHWRTRDPNMAGIGCVYPRNQVEQRGLTRTTGAYDGELLSDRDGKRRNLQVEPVLRVSEVKRLNTDHKGQKR